MSEDDHEHINKENTKNGVEFARYASSCAGFVKIHRLPVITLICGLVLSIVAFTSLTMSINGKLSQQLESEYDRVSRETAEEIVKNLKAMDQSLQIIAAIAHIVPQDEDAALAAQIEKSVSNLSAFDEILWVFETEPGRWRFRPLYERNGEESAAFRFSRDKFLIEELKAENLIGRNATTVLLNFESVKMQEEASGSISMHPFILSRAVKYDDTSKGVILALGHAELIITSETLKNERIYEQINLRDLESNTPLYVMDKSKDMSVKASLSRAYEFEMGNRAWEIMLDSSMTYKRSILDKFPYLLLFSGFAASVIAAFYVHHSQKQAHLHSQMNRELEEKNALLESEIAERERLNEALKASERDNRAIIDAVSDIIFETDTSGEIIFLSARWRKVTGFDIEQSIGLNLFSLLHPEDHEMQKQDFALFVKGQKQAYRTFTRLRGADGTFRAVEMAISVIRQGENRKLRVVGSFTDVEERRRAERALSEAEKKYRAIVENAAGGIYQLTPEGLYLSANPAFARILGYSGPEEILRDIKNANQMIYADPEERSAFLARLNRENVINHHETRMVLKNGNTIWVNENVRVVYDEHGDTLYYEGSVEDITKRKESELALREAKLHSDMANRAKSEFLANMSHELRTPLNAIIGFSEIIKDEMFGPVGEASYLEYAGDIHKSGKGLLEIINEILDIAKIDAGERQLNEGVVDLNAVVSKSLDLLSGKANSNQITVHNTIEDMPQIVGEELAIKQICMNLITNAIKFTPSGGSLTISCERDAQKNLSLSFTDTGIGMDDAEIKLALQPFSQIDTALDRDGSGTGLGLTLVTALIELHGGRLELFSQKGVGTTATVLFPASRVSVKKAKDKA